MRLALALAALVVASPAGAAKADELPDQDIKGAVETEAHLIAIERFCPKYRANNVRLAGFQRFRGLEPGTTHPTFNDIYFREMREMRIAFRRTPTAFCNYAWDTHGPDGIFPHLIERRD